MSLFLQIFGAWLFADFLSGIAHWAQDRIMNPSKNNFANMIVNDNILHHTKPTAMLKFSLFENVRIAIYVMWPVAGVLYLMGCPIVVWLGFFLLAFANGVHWFSHKRKNIWPIKILQKIGIFCSFEHHRVHHATEKALIMRRDATIRYCVMTNWINPILDFLRFFRFLEFIFRQNYTLELVPTELQESLS